MTFCYYDTHMKIAIIGGGLTGLVAAYQLVNLGHEISIYEKTSELGGLASGFLIHGENLEKTYHHIFKTDKYIISLIDELGIGPKLEWYDSSVCIYYDKKLYPFSGPLDLLKFSPLSFLSRVRLGLVIFFLQKYKSWQKLEKISAYEWMKKYCGEEAMKVIWEPLLKGKFERFYDKVSMAWLWARLHIRSNSRKFGEGEKLGYFNGGFQVIIDKLVENLKKKSTKIFLRANVKQLKSENSKVKVFIDSFRSIEYDKVICTVPSYVFCNLIKHDESISFEYLKKLNSIDYLGAICIVFSSKQNLSDYYWHNINDLQAPFLVFIHHTKLIPKERYDGNYVYYLGTYLPHEHPQFRLSDEVLSEKWFNYLKSVFPKFDKNQVITKSVFRFKNAQHVVDLDYSSKIPDFKTPLENVYLSNFSQIFPEDRGTNFAVREGFRIAKLCLEN